MTPHHPTTPPAAEGMLSHEPKFITCFLCGLQQRASTYYKNHLKACTVAWVEEERLLVAELVNGDFGPDNGLRPEVSRRAVVLPTTYHYALRRMYLTLTTVSAPFASTTRLVRRPRPPRWPTISQRPT
jgi:hypothetical protein